MIYILGSGSYSKLIKSQYKLKQIDFRDFNKTFDCSATLELCIPSDLIYESLVKYVDLGFRNFIIPKTFTKNLQQIQLIRELYNKFSLNIKVSSQYFYSKSIDTFITPKKLYFTTFNDKSHYRVSNTLLPHQIHILYRLGIKTIETIKILKYNSHISHFIINNSVEIFNDFRSNTKVNLVDEFDLLSNEQHLSDMIDLQTNQDFIKFLEMEEMLHKIDIELSKNKLLVIGGGIFGCTIANKLNQLFNLSIFEKNDRLLGGSSYTNQYRLHLGFHYPRADVSKFKYNFDLFVDYYKDFINFSDSYYAISKFTKVSNEEYKTFLKKYNLPIVPEEPNIPIDNITHCYKSNEAYLNVDLVQKFLNNKLADYTKTNCNIIAIDVLDNNRYLVKYEWLGFIYSEVFKFIINSTYSNINEIIGLIKKPERIYKNQLVEIFIAKPPHKFPSIAIMDGRFSSIVPKNDLINLYDVELSVLDENIDVFKNLKYPTNTSLERFNKIINKMKLYYPSLENCVYIKSEITNRILVDNKDDSRDTLVYEDNPNFYSVLSGKLIFCVDIANKFLREFTLSSSL
jgi:hypothetical protein